MNRRTLAAGEVGSRCVSERPADIARRRMPAARALTLVACLVIALAAVALYLRIAVVDSDQFAGRAAEALRDESVRGLVAQRLTELPA